MTKPSIPPANAPLVDNRGRPSPEWYRFFARQERNTSTAAAGEIVAGSGLTGGGVVADGVTLSVAPNGISNLMLRNGLGTSVIGRDTNSTGTVADIVATADRQMLTRENAVVAFRNIASVEALTLDRLSFTDAPVVSAATPSTHKIAVKAGGVTFYLLCTT